ncbi:protein kinase domain-containing protein [Streptomyces aidingensis]|uniref:Protein kinase domain-containing protein n=1 Tax=Streptomyces aidingensis TaxID=910347 RepID=A0A1I1R2S8_9ACTN|nr:protein kinase [Streptomyces aidingensis]SFD25833.1 Protein kinase domain-containing protein [Streptomyces aidingensis]
MTEPPRTADRAGTVPPTEHEPFAAPTEHEAEAAGATGPAPDPRGDADALPPALAARYERREVRKRPAVPQEAAVLRVTDRQDGTDCFLKWYHPGHRPDPEVWRILRDRPADGPDALPHVLRLHRAEVRDGHPFDTAPVCGETHLAAWSQDRPGPAPLPFVHAVVRQAAAALTALHRQGIVHRDLSPANLVLGSLDPPGPDLTVIDFSDAVHAPRPRFGAASEWVGTARYQAPEAGLARQLIHPPADWWSLGMIIAELAGGRHPVRHLTADGARAQVVSGYLDLSAVTDPRLKLLCRGLLTQDFEYRWGAEEVAAWLAGGTPATARRPADRLTGDPLADDPLADDPLADGRPDGPGAAHRLPVFPFAGREFTEPRLLGQALAEHWETARRALARRGTRTELVDWLRNAAASPRYGEGDREELTALLPAFTARRPPGPADVVRLLNWLAPTLPPVHRREPVDPAEGLALLAERAAGLTTGDGDPAAADITDELLDHRILPLLDARRGGSGLSRLHQQWAAELERWPRLVAALHAEFPELRRRRRTEPAVRRPDARLRAAVLWTVAAPEAVRRFLAHQAARQRELLPAPVPWYTWLLGDEGDPLRLLLAHTLALDARDDAEQAALRQRIREEEARTVAGFRREDAFIRSLEHRTVLAWAVGGGAALTFVWIFVLGITDALNWAPQETVALAWIWAVPGAAAVFALELWTAQRIGAPCYHPDRSLAGLVIRGAERPARRARRSPLAGALALAAALGVLVLTLRWAAWVWPAATVSALGWWTWHRHRRWTGEHRRLRDLAWRGELRGLLVPRQRRDGSRNGARPQDGGRTQQEDGRDAPASQERRDHG